MNTIRFTRGLLAGVVAVSSFAGSTIAAEPPSQAPAPSKAMREQMATVHEKMALCLRSDKSFAECRDEMQKNCQDMDEHACPMMGMGRGMGMRNRMQ